MVFIFLFKKGPDLKGFLKTIKILDDFYKNDFFLDV